MSKTNIVTEKLLFQRLKFSQTFLSFPLQLLFGKPGNKNNFLDIGFVLAPFVKVFRVSKSKFKSYLCGQKRQAWSALFSFFVLYN